MFVLRHMEDREKEDPDSDVESGDSAEEPDSGSEQESDVVQAAAVKETRTASYGYRRGEATGTEKAQAGDVSVCKVLECTADVMCIRYSPDGNLLAAGQKDGIIRLFNPENGQCQYTLNDSTTHLPVTAIRFRPGRETEKAEHQHVLIATYASGMIKFWHYRSNVCNTTINEPKTTLALSMNSNGQRFVTAGDDAGINVYDMETKKLVESLEASDSRDHMDGHRMRIFSVCYHPVDPHVFLSGGWDNTMHFWDDREKHSIRRVSEPFVCGDAIDIDATHDHILTGSWRKNNALQIWDFSGTKIKDVPQDLNSSNLYCCQWVGKDSIVCGGCDANTARVIDRGTLNTVGQLVDLPQGVYSVDNDHQFRSGGRPKIAVASGSKVWIVRIDKK